MSFGSQSIVNYNALIARYASSSQVVGVVSLFCTIRMMDVPFDVVTMLSFVLLCSMPLHLSLEITLHSNFQMIAIVLFYLINNVVALFGRVGDDMYTKVADVGTDFIGKLRGISLRTIQEVQLLLLIMMVLMLGTLLVRDLTSFWVLR
ncbi:hypothetical protein Ancab_034397 [Ancistrocladus abbreviatus]